MTLAANAKGTAWNDEAYREAAEEMVLDDRAELKPSDIVQSKLLNLLTNGPVPVSCQHTARDTRREM